MACMIAALFDPSQAFARPMVLQWLCAQIAERKKAVKAELIEAEAGRVPARQSR